MKKMLLTLGLAATSSLCFAATNTITHTSNTNSANNANKVAYTNTKKDIMVTKQNTHFTLTLKSNATTGYSWYLLRFNSQLIKPLSHKYVAPNSKLMGAPGYEEWTFSVLSDALTVPTITRIKMVYAQPWDLKQGNKTTFTIVAQ